MVNSYRFGLATFLLFLGVGIWSFFGTLDYVTVTQGFVTPSNKIKKIQHLEGGIIRSILVFEGQRVGEGAPLIELQATKSEAEFNELETRLAALQIDLIRLEAEQGFKKKLIYSAKIRGQHPSKIEKAVALFQIRKTSLENRVSAQKNVVQQKIQDMEEIQQRISKNKKYLKILTEKITISSNLLKDDLSNRLEHLKYLEQKIGIEGKISEDFWSLEKSKTAIKEAKLRILSLRDSQKETALSEYNEKNNAYEELRFRRDRLLDSRSRTMIRSPVSGRVKYLYYSTIGGVVAPGAVVVEVVPEAGKLIIEARLPVNERAYVKLGQQAKVRLTSPGPAGFGQLNGFVDYISADSISDQNGVPYFLVRISVDGKNISYNGKNYELASGESVECRILIGERRIINYFIEPFWKGASMALREH
ncbi:MAG: Type I secretion system membrane fusion protein PrsE [Alphaproteobacteria bacterium MarineAlpha11_Bin1]|nr:MAG: Type I secretion system membrane fusion protein PrsE [Alphaproteobacteria bacterium MarineAlpha11_Bin1]